MSCGISSWLIVVVGRAGRVMKPIIVLAVMLVGFVAVSWSSLGHAVGAVPAARLWSFQPLVDAAVPKSGDRWVHGAIDEFILQRLASENLRPSPPADARTVIRRLYLDVLGLPPAPAEVSAFARDRRPDAYERLVERVLANPHYGERWGQHWLDVVRYGESDGFETNRERDNAFYYRDYVVRSLNEDHRYDEFVMEQLAGDALDKDAGTGFLVAGPHDIVKSPDINLTLSQRQDELADMVNATGTTFLGVTIGCARCHDHKFDPIPQADFFALQAVFAGVQHAQRQLSVTVNPELRQQEASLNSELADLRRRMIQLPIRPPVETRENQERFEPVTARFVRFSIQSTIGNGQPCIDELEIYTATNDEETSRNVALAEYGSVATSSSTLPGYAIHQLEHVNDGQLGNANSWISNEPGGGWVQIEFSEVVIVDSVVWGRDRHGRYTDRLASEYRIEVATEPDQWKLVASHEDRLPVSFDLAGGEKRALRDDTRQRPVLTDQDRADLVSLLHERSWLEAELKPLRERIHGGEQAYLGSFQQPPRTHILYRGDPLTPQREIAPASLSSIRAPGELGLELDEPEQRRRLALARWIASDENPLTARVIANRFWQYHFGRGIVATASDFGANGVPPTHSELLD